MAEDPEVFGALAREWIQLHGSDERQIEELRACPLPYSVWGSEGIDDATVKQMETALRLPVSVGGALMPDAHLGYGLPVGGVLATKGAIVPWAVGVDIACRLRLSVFPLSPHVLGQKKNQLKDALLRNTVFGAGGKLAREDRMEHEVLDDPAWNATSFLRGLKDIASVQLGTSGSGNHFAEWGVFEATGASPAMGDVEEGGRYLALLTHSGSRGVGFKIANRYSKIAKERHPNLEKGAADLAWLELSSEEGAEYWLSMELAGRFAAANHAVIHDRMADEIRTDPIFSTEHHHNFCVAGDQLVPTTIGPKRMDEIQASDVVYACDPEIGLVETEVLDTWCSGYEKTYTISTDSRRIECTGSHRVLVISMSPSAGRRNNPRRVVGNLTWKQADELIEGDLIVCADGYFSSNHSIGEGKAHLLGAFLGDGWVRCTNPEVSGYNVGLAIGAQGDKHTSNYRSLCERVLPSARWSNNAPGAYGLTCSSKAVHTNLAEMGFAGNGRQRTLPSYVYSLTQAEKMELLAGYMDADGSVSGDVKNHGRGTIASTNKALATGLRELAISCGMRVTPIRKEHRASNFGPHIAYRCVVAAASMSRLILWHRRKAANLNYSAPNFRGLATGKLGGVVLPEGLFAQKVRKVESSEISEPVYDLSVEHNSHSFVCSGVVVHNCWKEEWRGEEVVVHRKGATPAGSGTLGIIPGTMADPGFVTLGLGNEDSVNSASHGAGRRMSRTQAFKTLDEAAWRNALKKRGVTLIGGSLDEAPGAYKSINEVMREQVDLVEVMGHFQPVLVRMDESKPRKMRR